VISANSKNLRNNGDALSIIPDLPGYYKWWAPGSIVKKLLGDFYEQLLPHLTQGQEEFGGYCYIYVGIATKSLRERLDWHVNQKHSLSAIKSGFLSTFRASISSLISGDQSDTDETNDIINEMLVEYEISEDFKEMERMEMKKHQLPLNIQGQPHVIIKNGFTRHLKQARRIGKELGCQRLRGKL
jgi:hypothetical protein